MASGLENNPDAPDRPEAELVEASTEFLADGPEAAHKCEGYESLEGRAKVQHF